MREHLKQPKQPDTGQGGSPAGGSPVEKGLRIALMVAVIWAVASICAGLGERFRARLDHEKGMRAMEAGAIGLGLSHLESAARWDPHLYRAREALAQGRMKLAENAAARPVALAHVQKAHEAMQRVTSENPKDADAWFRMARIATARENLENRGDSRNRDNGCDSLCCLQKAVELRPNGVLYHQYLLEAAHDRGRAELIPGLVEHLAGLHPRLCDHLPEKSWWREEYRAHMERGLGRAARSDRSGLAADACFMLAKLSEQKGEFGRAAAHYRTGLGHVSGDPGYQHDLRLGQLLYKDGRVDEAMRHFSAACLSANCSFGVVARVRNVFKQCGALADFPRFLEGLPGATRSLRGRMLLGRTHFELEQMDEAEAVFGQAAREYGYSAESWHWLGRIARHRQDWDALELHTQRAASLDPANARFRFQFVEALQRQGKLAAAEEQATLGLESADKPTAWMYNTRAHLRFAREKYRQAREDWRAARSLDPSRHHYLVLEAEACHRMGLWGDAKALLARALKEKPGDKGILKRLSRYET